MISLSHKFILIQPNKTGSSSMVKVLIPYAHETHVIDDKRRGSLGIGDRFRRPSKHITFTRIKELWDTTYSDVDINDMQTFGVVRNPWSRIVSHYFWKYPNASTEILNIPLFRKMVRRNIPCAAILGMKSKRPVQNILRFENLEEDFKSMLVKVGIPDTELPKINTRRKPRKHYTEYYTPALRDMVSERYAVDVECFGYTFEK